MQEYLSVPLNNLSFPHLSAGIACIATLMVLLVKGYSLTEAPCDFGSIVFIVIMAVHAVTTFVPWLMAEEHHFWMVGPSWHSKVRIQSPYYCVRDDLGLCLQGEQWRVLVKGRLSCRTSISKPLSKPCPRCALLHNRIHPRFFIRLSNFAMGFGVFDICLRREKYVQLPRFEVGSF